MNGVVEMVQQTPHKWLIRSVSGGVLQNDITAHSVYEATEYIKKWVSSFSGWEYKLILLENNPKVNRK